MQNKLQNIYLVFVYIFALTSCFSISVMSIGVAVLLILFLISFSINIKSSIHIIPKDFGWFIAIYAYKGFTLLINSSIQNIGRIQEIFDKSPYLSLSMANIQEKHINRILHIFFITNSIIIIYAVGESYLHLPVIYKSLFTGGRLNGYFSHALQYAGYISIFTILSFTLGNFYKRHFIYYFPVLFTGIILSGSRSYIVSVILVVIIVSAVRSIRVAGFTIILVSVITSIYSFLNPSFLHRIYYIIHPMETGSFVARVHMWQKSWEVFIHHPIFGVGYQNLPLYLKELLDKGLIDNISHAHNIYLNELAEIGIVGFVLSIGMLIYFVFKYLKIYKTFENNLYRFFSLSLSMIFINLMLAGFLEYNLGTAVVWMPLTFLMGLHLSYKNGLYIDGKRNN